jgi:hypothetical protein
MPSILEEAVGAKSGGETEGETGGDAAYLFYEDLILLPYSKHIPLEVVRIRC